MARNGTPHSGADADTVAGAGSDSKAHFVLVPTMYQGHLIPAVDTALLLARHGATASVVVTPSNTGRVRPSVDAARRSGLQVRLVEVPLDCAAVGLPEGADDANKIPRGLEANYFRAMALLRAPLERLLRAEKPYPTCVVADFCSPWTIELATNLGVPRLTFFTTCAFFFLCQYNVERFNAFDGIAGDDEPVVVPGLEKKVEVTRTQTPDWFRDTEYWGTLGDDVQRAVAEGDGIVWNTFLEMEAEYVAAYAEARKVKVWTVGPVSLYHQLAGAATPAARGNTAAIDTGECLRWLDGRAPSSVVYVSFGSTPHANPNQVVELGMGLEASGHPFIWVLKNAGEYGEVEREFLQGLEARVAGRGLLIRGWAPQVLILSHAAVGAFMTHCGWNSMMEAITAGLPVVTWPHFHDQFLIDKLAVEELETGVSVGVKEPFYHSGALVGREGVEKAVRSVMDGGDKGEERRRRARALAGKARAAVEEGGSSHANLLDLIDRFGTNPSHGDHTTELDMYTNSTANISPYRWEATQGEEKVRPKLLRIPWM